MFYACAFWFVLGFVVGAVFILCASSELTYVKERRERLRQETERLNK